MEVFNYTHTYTHAHAHRQRSKNTRRETADILTRNEPNINSEPKATLQLKYVVI